MYYIVSNRGEEISSIDGFTNAVFMLMEAPKGAEIFNENTPTGITSEHEAIQLLIANTSLRVCDAFETVKISKENNCSFKEAAIINLRLERDFIGSGEPCTTEVLQYAGTFGIDSMFLTPNNTWK